MDNFLIGLHEKCDEEKFSRDFMDGFYGVEACLYPDITEVEKLSAKARRLGFHWGAHYPLIKKDRATRDPLFLSLIEAEREEAFADFEQDAAIVSRYGGTYLLTHFPKPFLVSDSFDLSFWRFRDREWLYERDYPLEVQQLHLRGMFRRLDDIASRRGVRVLLENDAMSPFLTHSGILEELFGQYPCIEACLDVGRLHLQEHADAGFDGMAFAAKLAPYTTHLHLWNSSPAANITGGHLPVSPAQKPDDGFADIKAYLDLILSKGKKKTILFEHQSQYLSDAELKACYEWVDGIQKNVRRDMVSRLRGK